MEIVWVDMTQYEASFKSKFSSMCVTLGLIPKSGKGEQEYVRDHESK